MSFVVRTARHPESIVPEARAARGSGRPRRDGRRADDGADRDELLRQQRTSAVVIAAFALGALLLAAMGLFGVVSSSVTRRRHEMAVRMALGADHGRVLRLVLGEGALLAGIGVLIGIPGIYGAGRVIRGVLVGVSPSDPLTLAAVCAGLASSRWSPVTSRRAASSESIPRRRFGRTERPRPGRLLPSERLQT